MFIRRFGRSSVDCFQLALQFQQLAMALVVEAHRKFGKLEKLLADSVQAPEEDDADYDRRGYEEKRESYGQEFHIQVAVSRIIVNPYSMLER